MKALIETRRLLIREITLEDADQMFRLYSDPDVLKYTGEPLVESLQEMKEAIRVRILNHEKYGYGRWATILKDGMQFIGWAGLAYLPEFDEIDLGYRFFPKYWGAGLATEASQAILHYGFDTLKLKRIIAIAMKDNKASIRVMEKVGMQFDKISPYEAGSEDAVWYWCDQQMIAKRKHQVRIKYSWIGGRHQKSTGQPKAVLSSAAEHGRQVSGEVIAFVGEKPDFYEITDDLPQFEASSDGKLVDDYCQSGLRGHDTQQIDVSDGHTHS